MQITVSQLHTNKFVFPCSAVTEKLNKPAELFLKKKDYVPIQCFLTSKKQTKHMQKADFTPTVTKYAYSLRPFALSLTRDMEDAQDLIQETLLRALSSQEKFAEGTNLKAWLYTIMKNIFINNYRRNKKRNTIIDTTDDMYVINSNSTQVSNSGESNIAMENVTFAVNMLQEEFRVPFMMHYQGFKYHEIADHLTLPIGTVKSRIHFARKELKKKLKRF